MSAPDHSCQRAAGHLSFLRQLAPRMENTVAPVGRGSYGRRPADALRNLGGSATSRNLKGFSSGHDGLGVALAECLWSH